MAQWKREESSIRKINNSRKSRQDYDLSQSSVDSAYDWLKKHLLSAVVKGEWLMHNLWRPQMVGLAQVPPDRVQEACIALIRDPGRFFFWKSVLLISGQNACFVLFTC